MPQPRPKQNGASLHPYRPKYAPDVPTFRDMPLQLASRSVCGQRKKKIQHGSCPFCHVVLEGRIPNGRWETGKRARKTRNNGRPPTSLAFSLLYPQGAEHGAFLERLRDNGVGSPPVCRLRRAYCFCLPAECSNTEITDERNNLPWALRRPKAMCAQQVRVVQSRRGLVS